RASEKISPKAKAVPVGSTTIGRSAIRLNIALACAAARRPRFSPTRRAFATSSGQTAGTIASTPAAKRSSTDSAKRDPDSGKHHAKVTDAWMTRRSVAAAFIYQFAYREPFKTCSLANLAQFANRLLQVYFLGFTGRYQ